MPQDAEPPDVRRICLYAASTHRNGREIASLADYQLGHVRGCPQGRRNTTEYRCSGRRPRASNTVCRRFESSRGHRVVEGTTISLLSGIPAVPLARRSTRCAPEAAAHALGPASREGTSTQARSATKTTIAPSFKSAAPRKLGASCAVAHNTTGRAAAGLVGVSAPLYDPQARGCIRQCGAQGGASG
jgi:hypothetical protein